MSESDALPSVGNGTRYQSASAPQIAHSTSAAVNIIRPAHLSTRRTLDSLTELVIARALSNMLFVPAHKYSIRRASHATSY